MKRLLLVPLLLILTACSTLAQPTPTNVPPPPVKISWSWNPPADAAAYSNVTYQVWMGTNSGVYSTNFPTSNTTLTISNYNWGTNYLAVTASSGGDTSPYSAPATFVIQPPMSAPSGLAGQLQIP